MSYSPDNAPLAWALMALCGLKILYLYVMSYQSLTGFLTCVFWILKSTDDLLATSSFGILCSMASKGESKDENITQLTM